jgi:tetratricopeptide (TPR) repeat protein
MMMKISTLLVALLLTCGASQAASPKLHDCLGSVDKRISVEDFKKCESYTLSKKITARQKAQLFLQLGITVETDQLNSRSTRFKNQPTLPVEYWEKAIAADKTYAEPYLILAATFGYRQQSDSKRQFLDAGRIAVPDDPRFEAEIALIEAKTATAATVGELCGRATAHPSADKSVFYNCGEAFWRANLKSESEAAFRKAVFDFPVEQTSRYGVSQSYIDASTFATHLNEDNRTAEAAEFFEKYISLKPTINVDFTELEMVGDLYLKAGRPQQAAAVFERGARQTKDDMQHRFRLRQIVSLATAGNSSEATLVSKEFYERATKKQVLQLQLKLKNGNFKRLPITGKFDDETKSSLAECIVDSNCFVITPGQLL